MEEAGGVMGWYRGFGVVAVEGEESGWEGRAEAVDGALMVECYGVETDGLPT